MRINVTFRGGAAMARLFVLLSVLGAPLLHAETDKHAKSAATARKPQLLPARFTSLIKAERSLVEYWSFNGNTLGSRKKLGLKTVMKENVFQPGPFDDCRSIDLVPGQALYADPAPVLDSPQITAEMLFMVPGSPKKQSGEGCLLGIRNGKDARFSVYYRTGSYYLDVWNGKESIPYESDFFLQTNQWYHLAVSMSVTSTTVWVNGKVCRARDEARRGFGTEAKTNLPLVIGANDVAGQGEQAGIRVSQLAVYSGLLSDSSIANRVKALGWPDPGELNDAQKLDRQVAEMWTNNQVRIRWKYGPELVPGHLRNYMKVGPASVQEARMIVGLCGRMFKAWPKDVTRHIKGVYIFDYVEMQGVRGVCMANEDNVYMSSYLPEYTLWPRLIHESSHVVSRAVPLDTKLWNSQMAEGARYIGAEATKGDPFTTSEKLYQQGFLVQYAQIDLDEEFAILSQYIFTSPDEVKALMKKYPAVRKRVALTIDYYKALSNKIDFSGYDDIIKKDTTGPGQGGAGESKQPKR